MGSQYKRGKPKVQSRAPRQNMITTTVDDNKKSEFSFKFYSYSVHSSFESVSNSCFYRVWFISVCCLNTVGFTCTKEFACSSWLFLALLVFHAAWALNWCKMAGHRIPKTVLYSDARVQLFQHRTRTSKTSFRLSRRTNSLLVFVRILNKILCVRFSPFFFLCSC